MNCSVKIILYIHKKYSSGEHPVMLDLVKDRQHKRIGLGYRAIPQHWDKPKGCFNAKALNYTQRNLILTEHLKRALTIIDDFNSRDADFTPAQFEALFRGETTEAEPTTPVKTVYQLFQEKIQNQKDSRKIGNAKVYEDACRSFFNFAQKKELLFSDLNVELLEKYEVFLRKNGGADGGISVKMRTLRAIYNDAVKKGHANANDYPFRKYGINKLKGGGIKKALTREEVRLIENLDLQAYPHLTLARHLFVFSYYTRGMNFVDMMKLRRVDISDGRITYIRSKTHAPFVVKIVPPVQEILDYYQQQPSQTGYIFPVLLTEDLNPTQIANRKHKVLTHFNQHLKEIAQIVGIRKNLSSYAARHSFATNLKFSGVAISIISESLGHRSQEVTETYLKSFENSVIDEAVERLL